MRSMLSYWAAPKISSRSGAGTGRRTARAVLAGALAAGLLGGGALDLATSPAAVASESEALSGLYTGAGDVAGVRAFESWRGAKVGVVTEFVDSSSWASISKPTWAADRWKHTDYLIAWGVPMLPKTGGTIQAGAAGSYNAHFKTLSQTLVDRGLGDSVIRLGWEMNGTWFSWSAVKDPAAFNSYWRQVVTTMRTVPGAAFKFEWAPNLGEGTSGFDKTKAYPGDAYVDVIGVSSYDQSWAYAPDQAVKRWNSIVTVKGGLQWHVDFAKAHGKPNALSEWALSDRCDGHGGGDNPYYLEQVAKWIDTHDYLYESYFDYRTHACEQHSLTDGPFPSSRAAYKTFFGPTPVAAPVTTPPADTSASAPTPVPVADPAPVPSAPADAATVSPSVIKVSWSANRSNPVDLAWKGVSSNVYIFAAPTFATSKVSFYLDDPTMSRAPLTVEGEAPWDLAGGTAATAKAFDMSKLAPGKHTLTVAFDTPAGKKVTQVTFLR